MTTAGTDLPAYWTDPRHGEPPGRWIERLALRYARHNPAVLARLDRIEQTEREQGTR